MIRIFHLINSLFNFFSTYFESLLAIDIFFIIGLIVIFSAARLRSIFIVNKLVKVVLFWSLLGLQTILVVLTVAVVLGNLKPKQPLDFSAQISATTRWVREDLTIYFIHENDLISIRADGSDRRTVFHAPGAIRQYCFSPNGRYLLITTERELILFDKERRTDRRIDALAMEASGDGSPLRGSIDGVQWDRQSLKFCYRLSQWSEYAAIERWTVYELKDGKKYHIDGRALPIPKLTWNWQGDRLYFIREKQISPEGNEDSYLTLLYEVDMKRLFPRMILTLKRPRPSLSLEDLARSASVRLYDPHKVYSFGYKGQKRTHAVSRRGATIGIDRNDVLYYISSFWWRKRLYRVPRIPEVSDIPRYQYRGGQLAVDDLRFLPSGRYVIMEHYFWGILILDPVSGKVGILDNQQGNTFGWFPG